MTGFLIPTTSGNHTIDMGYIDYLGIINIGAEKFLSENCCSNFNNTGSVLGDNTVESIWSYTGPTGVNRISADLVAGVAYPIGIFFCQQRKFGGYVFNLYRPQWCFR